MSRRLGAWKLISSMLATREALSDICTAAPQAIDATFERVLLRSNQVVE